MPARCQMLFSYQLQVRNTVCSVDRSTVLFTALCFWPPSFFYLTIKYWPLQLNVFRLQSANNNTGHLSSYHWQGDVTFGMARGLGKEKHGWSGKTVLLWSPCYSKVDLLHGPGISLLQLFIILLINLVSSIAVPHLPHIQYNMSTSL